MSPKETIPTVRYVNEIDSDIETSTVTDQNGDSINDSGKSANFADRDYFTKAKETKEIAISDVIVGRLSGNKIITIAMPILNDSKDFRGMIMSAITVSTLEKSIGQIKVGKTGYVYLISKNGNIIYHPDSSRFGKSYKEYAKNATTLKAFNEEILAKDSGFITYTDDNGVKTVVAYSTVARTGWKVVVTVPSSEVYGNLEKTIQVSLIIILIAVILVVIVATNYLSDKSSCLECSN